MYLFCAYLHGAFMQLPGARVCHACMCMNDDARIWKEHVGTLALEVTYRQTACMTQPW